MYFVYAFLGAVKSGFLPYPTPLYTSYTKNYAKRIRSKYAARTAEALSTLRSRIYMHARRACPVPMCRYSAQSSDQSLSACHLLRLSVCCMLESNKRTNTINT